MNKRLVILGAGESGVGAAVLGQKKGYLVFVSDQNAIPQKYKDVLLHYNIDWEEKQHSELTILQADEVVKSPGIPDDTAIVKKLRQKAIPVISEIEFAARFTKTPLIAVTGSNGKTTVTHWISFMLKKAGINHVMAGNVGISFAKAVAEKDPDYFVLEVSSFQLDGIVDFHPHIAVLTNITPDHLDRYDHNFQKYIDAKFKITKNQTAADYFIYDAGDQVIQHQLKTKHIHAKKLPFSLNDRAGEGTKMIGNEIKTIIKNKVFTMIKNDMALEGAHNTKNGMAASTVTNLLEIREETIREGLKRFQGVEHRLEKVLKINNVQYINDSKATNINSVIYALESLNPQIIWIAGGVDKGNDYEELLPLVNERVKAIICLGIDNHKLMTSFNNCVETMYETHFMNQAVQIASEIAQAGDTVLLSPACASFDLFQNFEDRGAQFKEAVKNL